MTRALRRASVRDEVAILRRGHQHEFVAVHRGFPADVHGRSREFQDEFLRLEQELAGGQYFIEIQGHTDDTGGAKYNDDLGQHRADTVRRYLSRQDSVPLNRMSTISYGDTLPVAPNKNKAGRANRRVVLVVLE